MINTEGDEGLCPVCNGSGEGMHSDSVCLACKGSGQPIDEREQDQIAQGWVERERELQQYEY